MIAAVPQKDNHALQDFRTSNNTSKVVFNFNIRCNVCVALRSGMQYVASVAR